MTMQRLVQIRYVCPEFSFSIQLKFFTTGQNNRKQCLVKLATYIGLTVDSRYNIIRISADLSPDVGC